MAKTIYLDYAAATPLHREVKKVMAEVENMWANPSSLHKEGRQARAVIDLAREKVANAIGAETDEIIFTSGATESNVLAIRGVLEHVRLQGIKPHLIVSKIEHPSLREEAKQLEKMGLDVTWLEVDNRGLVAPDTLSKALKDNTALVSIIYGNHELGIVQNISELVRVSKEKNKNIIFHTDAAQSLGWLDVKVGELGVDLLTGSSYKLYGPKGVGFLYVKRKTKIQPLFPGMQEWQLRGGTEPTSLIAGLGKSLELSAGWPRRQVRALRDRLIKNILDKVDKVICNTKIDNSLPHIAQFSFAGTDSQILTIALDREGLSASPGSACSSGAVQVSHIVEAIEVDTNNYPAQLRLSLGINTTEQEIEGAVKIICGVVEQLRSRA